MIARAQQDPGDEVDRLLGAGGDDQVLGRRLDAPGAADPVGEGPAQRQQPGGVAVALGDLLEGGDDALAPLDEREQGRVGPTDAQVERAAGGAGGGASRCSGTAGRSTEATGMVGVGPAVAATNVPPPARPSR